MPKPQNRTWHKTTKEDQAQPSFFSPAWRVGNTQTPDKPYETHCRECNSGLPFDAPFIEQYHATEKEARDWKRNHVKDNVDKEPMHTHINIYKRVSESGVIEIDVEH